MVRGTCSLYTFSPIEGITIAAQVRIRICRGYAFSRVFKENRWSVGGRPRARFDCAAHDLSLDPRSASLIDEILDGSFGLP